MKQYKSVVVILAAVIVGAAVAYPEPGQPKSVAEPEPVAGLNDAVEGAIRQEIAEYITIICDTVQEPKLVENLEAIEELVAASLPESMRQDVANELSDEDSDGTLSDGLQERIRQHILDWLLQYLPEELRVEITTVLEEYRTTGRLIGNNEELVGRIHQYVASLDTDDIRKKRGFWKGLFKAVAIYCAEYLLKTILMVIG